MIVICGDNETASFEKLMNKVGFTDDICNADVLVAAHHGKETGYYSYVFLSILEICHIILAADEFIHTQWAVLVLLVLILLLYVIAFRKQTEYIRKRVERNQ